MWHTPEGDRVLRGAESRLVKQAITSMVESIREEASDFRDQWECGVRLFDQLPWSQRLTLLERVATFLFMDTPDCMELTAVNEAAVGAIFAHVRSHILLETSSLPPIPMHWRTLALEAYRQCFPEEEEQTEGDETFLLPLVTSEDEKDWDFLLEMLADRILWDRDYEMEDMFLDAPPERSRVLRQYLGIEADYFASVAPDVASDDGVQYIYERLERLTGSER